MTGTSDWQDRVGRTWAHEWKRTDRSFSGLTEHFLTRLAPFEFGRALDIGCGAGELSIALARSHPAAAVLGIDISADLVAAATARGGQYPNLAFKQVDAATWPGDGMPHDLFVSRHGVMFFGDPVAAFANLHTRAAPGAPLAFTCFRNASENEWASGLGRLLPCGEPAPALDPAPGAPGPFAFADPDYVRPLLTAAGWNDVAFEAVDFAYVAGAGTDAVADATSYFLAIGPAARAAAELAPAQRGAFIERLGHFLQMHRSGDMVLFDGAAWLVTARA